MTYLDRRDVLRGALAGGALLSFMGACAHRTNSGRVPRIGFLIGSTFPTMVAAFRDELRRAGYVEGENLILELRQARPNTADGAAHVAELLSLDLDLIVAAALPVALEVRRLNPRMPMVIATAPGLVSNGFARSLDRPGGNVTGMDELPAGLTGRRLRLLRASAPTIGHVAFLSTTPGRGGHEMQLADGESTAARLGLRSSSYRASSLAELEAALARMAADGVDGLVNFQGALSLVNRRLIIDHVAERRVPAIYQSRLFVESGGFMALSPDQDEQFRIAARYVDRILRGARPGDLPILHPERYYLSINHAAAAGIGLQFPQTIIAQADFAFP